MCPYIVNNQHSTNNNVLKQIGILKKICIFSFIFEKNVFRQ